MPRIHSRDGWTVVAFGDVVRQVKDRADPAESGLERYVAGEHMDTDDLRIRQWGIIGDGYLGPAFHMRFKPGQVLYGSRRTYLRKVALADFEGITANTTYVVESKNRDVLLPELLPYIMQTEPFHEHSMAQSKGSVNPYINFSDLVWYEFALPPLEEQRPMVEVLQSLEAASYGLVELQSALSGLADSLFDAQLGDGRQVRVGPAIEFCEFITDGDHNPPKRTQAGIPHLVVASIRDGKIDDSECTYISEADFRRVQKRYSPVGGDVLVSCVGSIGIVALVPEGYTFSADRSLAVYRTNRDVLLPEYAAMLFRSSQTQHYFQRIATGTAQLHLYLDDLRGQRIRVPDLQAQREMIARNEEVQMRLRSVSHRLRRLRLLRAFLISRVDGRLE